MTEFALSLWVDHLPQFCMILSIFVFILSDFSPHPSSSIASDSEISFYAQPVIGDKSTHAFSVLVRFEYGKISGQAIKYYHSSFHSTFSVGNRWGCKQTAWDRKKDGWRTAKVGECCGARLTASVTMVWTILSSKVGRLLLNNNNI